MPHNVLIIPTKMDNYKSLALMYYNLIIYQVDVFWLIIYDCTNRTYK